MCCSLLRLSFNIDSEGVRFDIVENWGVDAKKAFLCVVGMLAEDREVDDESCCSEG